MRFKSSGSLGFGVAVAGFARAGFGAEVAVADVAAGAAVGARERVDSLLLLADSGLGDAAGFDRAEAAEALAAVDEEAAGLSDAAADDREAGAWGSAAFGAVARVADALAAAETAAPACGDVVTGAGDAADFAVEAPEELGEEDEDTVARGALLIVAAAGFAAEVEDAPDVDAEDNV